MQPGCYTALITPYRDDAVDEEGLRRLVEFQIACGINGILAVGTTGESPVLTWEEHNRVTEIVARACAHRCLCIAGTGSNSTRETIEGTRHAAHVGARAVLLVDPYYNGPSSLEIRREYLYPVAREFPEIDIIPYVIPGRTGTQLLPEDLALASQAFPNIRAVKEATGDLNNMRRTRELCGSDFLILSGDDPLTVEMMEDPRIRAGGVISVASNVAPKAVGEMVGHLLAGRSAEARALALKLEPLFQLVTVKTTERTPFGEVVCRARNPLAYKTLMALLGMPAGGCRPPLGKMTARGLERVTAAARRVLEIAPEILQPVADFFGVDLAERLENPAYRKGLCYEGY
ncbi:MAG: 4-hydroxy-tetrahydrodipicolinate synthase [Desulfobacterales bacterium]